MPPFRRSLLAGLALALAASQPARAEEATGYRYDLHWGGFHAARFAISQVESGRGWRAGMELFTHGLMRRIFPFHMETEAGGPPAAEASRFASRSQSRSRQSWLEVERDPGTGLLSTTRNELRWLKEPPEDEAKPEPVTDEMRVGVLDPLSALREFGRRAREGSSFTLKIFDGRQRYDVKATVKGPGRQRDGDRVLEGILVDVEMIPLAGFRERMRAVWEGSSFTALVDPASGLPLRIVADTFIAATVITAVEPCRPGEDCRPPHPEP